MPTRTSTKAPSAKSGDRDASQDKRKISDTSPSRSSDSRASASRSAASRSAASRNSSRKSSAKPLDKAARARSSAETAATAPRSAPRRRNTNQAGVASTSKARAGSSPLGREQIEHFRSLLLVERARLEEEREQIRNRAGAVDTALPEEGEGDNEDTADLAAAMMDKEMDLSVEDEIEDLLAGVDHALQKIEDGTYGICDMAGEVIPPSRLELIPWAALCVECQALAEGQ